MICAHEKTYVFIGDYDWDLMFVTTFGIAVSLTCTVVYLVCYPISEEVRAIMENLNYQGYLVITYSITFTFIATEFATSKNYGYYLFLNVLLVIACLVLAQYKVVPRWVSLAITAGYVVTLFVFDWVLYATKKNYKVFYVPFTIEAICLSVGVVVLFFRVPERWCK